MKTLAEITKSDVADMVGDFTWNFGSEFFIETGGLNFVWSDPDYNGDDTITLWHGSYDDWIGDGLGRSKGKHLISRYCGTDFTLVMR